MSYMLGFSIKAARVTTYKHGEAAVLENCVLLLVLRFLLFSFVFVVVDKNV